MNIKALIEKKNELKAEYRSLIEQAQVEKRDLAGDTREAELSAQIEDINEQIKQEEARAAAEADIVENIDSTEEKRKMTNQLTQEMEVRAVEQFIRKQDGEEVRAVTTGAAPGSLTVPTHLSNIIVKKLEERAPLFSRTRNFTPVNGFLEILREQTVGTGGFVGEMENVTANDFTMDKVRLDQKRVGSAIELSQHLVNDSGIDVVNYAINILTRRLGGTLDKSILVGAKATQFEGLVTAEEVNIQKVETETADVLSIDDILNLYNAMNPEYQGDAVFVTARSTFNKLSKLKDGNGHYYMVRDVTATGVTYKLFGQPVVINDDMPALGAGQKAVLLANFAEGYATMTKQGLNLQHISGDTTQALRGSHLLLLDGYMDGKILNHDAFKVLVGKTV